MGVFRDLMDRLSADVARVHGRSYPLVWRWDPDAPPELAWCAYVDRAPPVFWSLVPQSLTPALGFAQLLEVRIYLPSYLHGEAVRAMLEHPRPLSEPVTVGLAGTTSADVYLGPSGEDPLRRLAERYARDVSARGRASP